MRWRLWTVWLAASVVWVSAAAENAKTTAAVAKRADSAQFTLRDGTTIVGKCDLKNVEITTAYGTLTVPMSDVAKIRVGKKSDRELKAKIDQYVSDLGSKDFAARDMATTELAKLGRLAYTELRRASSSEDVEVKERANKLLDELGSAEDDSDMPPEDDEVVTPAFTIVGTIKFDSLAVATRFGSLKVAKKDLAQMSLAEREVLTRNFSVLARNTANKMLATGLRLKHGDHLTVTAGGTVTYRNYGGTQFTPEGSSNYGTFSENLLIGSLIGRFGSTGTVFKVGEHFTDKIDNDGELYLGIAVLDAGASYGSGEYKVRVQVQPAGQ